MEIGHGKHICDAEGLGDVALPLHFAHPESVPADAVRPVGERYVGRGRLGHGSSFSLHCFPPRIWHRTVREPGDESGPQWISIPPFTSMTAPVMYADSSEARNR